jgi:hypothetical protein
MQNEPTLLEIIDDLYERGQKIAEGTAHRGFSPERLNGSRFNTWRKDVNEFLCSLEHCSDLSYKHFSREVIRPDVRDLEEGLRILFGVRDEIYNGLLHKTRAFPLESIEQDHRL